MRREDLDLDLRGSPGIRLFTYLSSTPGLFVENPFWTSNDEVCFSVFLTGKNFRDLGWFKLCLEGPSGSRNMLFAMHLKRLSPNKNTHLSPLHWGLSSCSLGWKFGINQDFQCLNPLSGECTEAQPEQSRRSVVDQKFAGARSRPFLSPPRTGEAGALGRRKIDQSGAEKNQAPPSGRREIYGLSRPERPQFPLGWTGNLSGWRWTITINKGACWAEMRWCGSAAMAAVPPEKLN